MKRTDFAKRFRNVLTEKDVLIKEVIIEYGCSRSSIDYYLTTGKPTIEFLVWFCQKYDVSADYLLGLKEQNK